MAVPLQSPSWGRATERWSTVGAPVAVAASTAGEVWPIAWVKVNPPLSASEPRAGFALTWSPVWLNPQVSVDSRL